jgi:serine/threonine protein kinase
MGFFDLFRRPKLKREEGRLPAGTQQQAAVARSEDWRPGQTLLDDFAVERVLGEGGMGKVYLVKNRTTNMRFAVKRARGLSEHERRNFLAELQTWIDLPEHPNLVPCRFFRTVEDEVLIFAEYVGGGSLKNWIDSRTLYEGGTEKTLERILDTAIQFAWGLQCLHELGLVHQDVKPANVMMDKDAHVAVQGVKARLTDYGLARARVAAGKQYASEPGGSILVSSGGYTPAYCSPEQAGGRKLDRRTDVWSWGVSVLEMFQGGVTWHSGSAVAESLKAFVEHSGEEDHIPAMPKGVAELLKGCFRKDPAQRWASMEAVVQKLREVYQAAVGAEYSRVLNKIGHRNHPSGRSRRTSNPRWYVMERPGGVAGACVAGGGT